MSKIACSWCAGALVVGMLVRGGLFLLHEPFYAYADNYDQVRTMGRFGIVPDDSRFPLGVGSFAAPLRDFHLQAQRQPAFYRSTDHRLVQATLSVSRWLRAPREADGRLPVDVRWKGILSFLLLAAGIGVCVRRLIGHAGSRSVAVGVAGAGMLLTDPFNLMYASTWYLEFSAYVYAAIGITAFYTALVRSPARRTGPYVAWLLILLFGVAKNQYVYFPLGMAVLALSWRARLTRPFLLFAVGSAVLLPVYASSVEEHPNSVQIRAANNANSLFGVFLQLPSDRATALRLAGLPPACAQFIGTTWFRPENNGEAIMRECPEVASVGQARKVALALASPLDFLTSALDAAALTQTWIDPGLGHVGGKDWGKLADEPSLAASSAATWVNMLPPSFYGAAYLAILAASTLLGGLVARRGDGSHPWSTAYALCGGVGSYSFVSAFFGDGFNDLPKHAHLSFSAVTLIVTAALLHVLSLTRSSSATHCHRQRPY